MTEPQYIEASDLAKELGVDISSLLLRADRVIEEAAQEGGIEAARGLSTGVKRKGQEKVTTVATISPALADRLRADFHG